MADFEFEFSSEQEQLREITAALRGTDTTFVDRYFFDFNE